MRSKRKHRTMNHKALFFCICFLLYWALPLNALATDLITGVVRDRNTGLPIQNARVFFYGSAYGIVFTDIYGQYTFTDSDLQLFGGALSGNLYVGTTGYFEAPPVYISDLGAQTSLPVVRDISLLPGGAMIQGTIRDASTGLGISGAQVSFERNPMCLFLGGSFTEAVQTNADGSYSIDSSFFNESGLSSGFSVSLKVNASGYLGANRSISFSDYPTMVDFSLRDLNDSTTLIELSSFEARPLKGTVILRWETSSELDTVGFSLYRAELENGEYTKISNFIIPAKGSASQGASYEFMDTGLRNGRTYYYKLEDIDLDGKSTMHGPKSATPRWFYGIFNIQKIR